MLLTWLGYTESVDFRAKKLEDARSIVTMFIRGFSEQHFNVSIQMGGMIYSAEGDNLYIVDCMNKRGLIKSCLNMDQWEII